MFEVIFYRDKNGVEQVKDYLYDLKRKGPTNKRARILANKIFTYIKVLQKYGTRVGAPYVKHIQGDLWELRPLNNRIFFFYWKDNIFVLLHQFTKKTQKTPPREIKKAQQNLKDFMERSSVREKDK